eukprot:1084446-Prorocentrum_minimum.AAC.1
MPPLRGSEPLWPPLLPPLLPYLLPSPPHPPPAPPGPITWNILIVGGEKWEKVGNWTRVEKRGRVLGVLSASLPLLA